MGGLAIRCPGVCVDQQRTQRQCGSRGKPQRWTKPGGQCAPIPRQATCFTIGVAFWICACKLPAPEACVCALTVNALTPSTSAAVAKLRASFFIKVFLLHCVRLAALRLSLAHDTLQRFVTFGRRQCEHRSIGNVRPRFPRADASRQSNGATLGRPRTNRIRLLPSPISNARNGSADHRTDRANTGEPIPDRTTGPTCRCKPPLSLAE